MASSDNNSSMSTGRLLLSAYLLLALGTFDNDGRYSSWGLALTAASFAIFMIAAVAVGRRSMRLELPPEAALAGALILFAAFGALKEPGYYASDAGFTLCTMVASYAVALCVAVAYLFLRERPQLRRGVFLGGLLVAIGLRVGMLRASPMPFIDVFELAQQSSGYLLHGFNPYSNPVWAAGGDGHIYAFNGYAYPPANLLLQSLMFALTKDARYANLLAELAFGGSLWLMTRGISVGTRQLLVLLHFFQPRSLFALENAWTEPLTLGPLAVSLWLWRTNRSSAAAALCGFVLTTKQYLVFVAPQYLILERRRKAWALLVAVGITTVLPFVLWDPKSFWNNGIMLVVSLPFSDSTLTLASLINRWNGWMPGPELSIGVGLIATLAFPLLLRRVPPLPRFLLATTGTLFTTFLCGTKAFFNYYYLVSGLMLMALALHAEREEARAKDVRPAAALLPAEALNT